MRAAAKRWLPARRRVPLAAAAVFLFVGCCVMRDVRWRPVRPPRGRQATVMRLETTGYCPCGQCCNWKRTWYGRPVIRSGPGRGRPKEVGMTASGRRARPGTIAADTDLFPFGTVMHVPGYGYGVVEDRGGAIRGRRIDLFFRRHQEALEWGRRTIEVRVWWPAR